MYNFDVNKKTGFFSRDKNLLIFDRVDGIPFYFRENLNGKQKFNLPYGQYETENKIYQLEKPLYYTKPNLKKRYNFVPYPENFKTHFINNPNKCTVDLDTNQIFFDHSFKTEPRFLIDFIKYHELGHYRYANRGQQSEKDCDNFARHCMLSVGYNPSQIHTASQMSLSEGGDARDRKKESKEYLKKINAI